MTTFSFISKITLRNNALSSFGGNDGKNYTMILVISDKEWAISSNQPLFILIINNEMFVINYAFICGCDSRIHTINFYA